MLSKLNEVLHLKTVEHSNEPDTARLIQSLQEHQIELEMQNEELRIAREQAESAIQKYTELYDFAPLAYYTLSMEGDILELNLCGAQMLGKERKMLINSRFMFFVSDETKNVFSFLLDRVANTRTKQTCEITLILAESNPVFVQLTCNLSTGNDKFLLIAIDITATKQDKETIKRSKVLMNSSLESQMDMVLFSVNSNYQYLYFNKVHSDWILNMNNIEIRIGMSVLEVISSPEREIVKGHIDRALQGESNSRIWKVSDEIPSYYESVFNPLRNEDQEIIGITNYSRNITQKKIAEELMRESKVLLDKTQELAHLGSWELDLLNGQVFWSDEAYRIFGLLPLEIAPSYDEFLLSTHPDDRQFVDHAYLSSLDENQCGYEIEHRVLHRKTGEERYVFEKCEHVRDSSGKVIRSIGMVQDITERKKVEEALVESEEKFRSFIQFSSDLLFSFNQDETYRFVNDAFIGLSSHTAEEITGKKLSDISPFEEVSGSITILQEVLRTKEKAHREARVINSNGEAMYFLTTADPVKNESGEVVYVNCVSKDITRLKNTEKKLRETQEIFNSFMEHSPIYVFFKDLDIRSIHLSKNFEKMFGLPLSMLLGKNMNEIFPSELANNMVNDDLKVLKEGNIITVEEEFNERKYSTIKFPIVMEGKPSFLAGFTVDITEQKAAEYSLKESQAQIAALLAAVPDMIFIQDSYGVYIEYHGPVSTELYIKPTEFIGKKMTDVIPSDIARLFTSVFSEAAKTGKVQKCEYSLELPTGTSYFEAKVVAFAESRFLTIIRNVSNYKEAESLIKQKNLDLEKLNAEKDKLFSIIAHDLRGPFSGFLGITETLAKRLPDMTLKEIQEITFLMRNSAVHLFRLIGNLLEWSRLQRGLSVFNPVILHLREQFEKSYDISGQLAFQKEIEIVYEISDDLEVFADENMLGSIFRNLLSNALKYTKRGGRILVSAVVIPENTVEVRVVDNGIGMSPALVEQLFRIDRNSNRKGTEGEYSSGLGLIICKDFIEKNGGHLSIISEEGTGSSFSFTIPCNPPVVNS